MVYGGTSSSSSMSYAPVGQDHHHHDEKDLPVISLDDPADRFPVKPPWRDLWAAIAFLLHLVFVVVIFIIGLSMRLADSDENENPAEEPSGLYEFKSLPWDEFGMIIASMVICALAGAGFTVVWLFLMRKLPKVMIYLSLASTLLIFTGMAVLFFVYQVWIFGVVLLLMDLLMCLLFFLWRKRIHFSALLLSTTMFILNSFKGTFVVAILGLVGYFVWFFCWTVTVLLFQSIGAWNETVAYLGMVFLVLSWYWTLQVIKNIVHVTIAGTVGMWYFHGDSDRMPTNPTWGAMKRACTTSFGSICFGSLIVAIVQTIRAVVASQRAKKDNFFLACLACMMAYLEGLLKYFNKYAYTQVAIYGKTYWQAAKATMNLMMYFGLDAVMNDSLVGNVLALGAIIGGLLCSILAGGMALLMGSESFFVVFFLGLFVGYGLVVVAMEVVNSAITAMFVCSVEQPQVMKDRLPELYESLQSRYSDICSSFFMKV